MTSVASAQAVAQALARVMAQDKGRLLSALAYRLRDISLAEDMLQEASLSALTHWARAGIPNSPQGWLLRVALRRAIDKMRAAGRAAKGQADLALLAEEEAGDTTPDAIPDARLRMMFTCCHPALEAKSQVALTLRVICGLTTPQIAAVFLDSDVAIGQRISRAKAKITAAGIGFAIPDAAAWPARLQSVLTAVYLIFTRGYAAGPDMGQDLCQEALFLARLLVQLAPSDPEIEGLLALILITHARAGARGQGALMPNQDRSLWDSAMLAEGLELATIALTRGQVGPYQIKAAIAACHVQGSSPDWPQIAALTATLLQFEDTPVVRLSHAVALGEVQGAQVALAQMLPLAGALADYGPFHAARAEFLLRAGDTLAAQRAYSDAIDMAETPQDRAVLAQRLAKIS